VIEPAAIVIGPDGGVQDFWLLVILSGGIAGGLVLLVRGLREYQTADRLTGIAPSRISSIALGEVLVTGTAEPIELTLVSPLQSAPCLYYRSRVVESGDSDTDIFREERAVGFRIRDPSGAIRIFPRGARFDVPERFNEQTGRWDGSNPPGLLLRTGPVYGPGPDRDAQIAALLTVRDPSTDAWGRAQAAGPDPGDPIRLTSGSGRRHFLEARIEPGDVVTIVGRVLPFSEVADPAGANLLDDSGIRADDPEILADLAAPRAAGILAPTPAAAWGNAAIEGFGIGRPSRAPELDPRATPPPPPDPAIAARARDAFEIAPDALVLADARDARLMVSLGAPTGVTARHQERLLVGLLGAIIAIASAMMLAMVMSGAVSVPS
jgi:hypothetical protein